MEKIVESGRGDVQTLAQDCQTLRREAVSAREELEKVQQAKGQLEVLVTQLQEDTGVVYPTRSTMKFSSACITKYWRIFCFIGRFLHNVIL